ncbi:MAG: hypothetical protein Hyperionvirus18_15 [Hyperionvirus sp.]|uniref:TRAF-type domain-containing protein n=1 Tax=Hyperionvirus sp. TaxID=2487770 RepID=A0A3G5AFI5_9VIRU|nr:MAG: hypothetical protein Hyperionvirus18_15 [Hyperionvirus sp.]
MNKLLCRNYIWGCNFRATGEEIEAHDCKFYPCPEAYSGCFSRGTKEEIILHKNDCKLNRCINEKFGCHARGTGKFILQHEGECGFGMQTCLLCRFLFRKSEIDVHQVGCKSNSAECIYCQKLFHSDLYETHLAICEREMKIAKCLYCNKYCLKTDFAEHVSKHNMSSTAVKHRNYDDG